MILLIGSIFLNGCDENTIRPRNSEETKKSKKLKKEQEEKEFLDLQITTDPSHQKNPAIFGNIVGIYPISCGRLIYF
ncbi:MAG: hypothetical protein SCARUB_04071 [Candidatus Scalindua rubra]|uniref:Uncharacterized protein n=1 Tax=Candidatus Scalindua rubra TaxID=1872076 RepID=A0A1E3X593_9BACT|nr:MAG: hypothetical protein SCARUB_04071 [Candidatus Scalindua rubra]